MSAPLDPVRYSCPRCGRVSRICAGGALCDPCWNVTYRNLCRDCQADAAIRAIRIPLYTARAARGLPLFESDVDSQTDDGPGQ